MDVVSKFLEQLALAAIPVVVPFVVAWLIAQTRKALSAIKKQNADVGYVIENAAAMAVAAAEQANVAGMVTDKKLYALDAAEKMLAAQGIKIDLDLLSAAIESAVYLELNRGKATEQVKMGFNTGAGS